MYNEFMKCCKCGKELKIGSQKQYIDHSTGFTYIYCKECYPQDDPVVAGD